MDQFDHSSRASNRLIAGLLIVSATLALVLVAVLAAVDLDAGEAQTTVADLPDGVIATVNGIDVNETQWEAHLAEVDYSREFMREQVAVGPDEFAGGLEMHASFERNLERLEAHPAEAIALAQALSRQTPIAEAAERGIAPDDDTVEALLAEQRGAIEAALADPDATAMDPGSRGLLEALIDAAGEEAFWTEILPGMIRNNLATEALFEDEVDMQESDWQTEWTDFQRDLVRDVDLELDHRIATTVTLADAIAYLDEVAAANEAEVP